MKRILYWAGVALVIGAVAGASYAWPEMAVWVAWAYCLLNWCAIRNREEWLEQVKASRDRWRKLHSEMGDALGGQLGVERARAKRLIKELSEALESQRVMLDKRETEIQRLTSECDRLQNELTGAYESHSFAQQRADRYEDFIQWLKKRGYVTVALVDQFMKLEEA